MLQTVWKAARLMRFFFHRRYDRIPSKRSCLLYYRFRNQKIACLRNVHSTTWWELTSVKSIWISQNDGLLLGRVPTFWRSAPPTWPPGLYRRRVAWLGNTVSVYWFPPQCRLLASQRAQKAQGSVDQFHRPKKKKKMQIELVISQLQVCEVLTNVPKLKINTPWRNSTTMRIITWLIWVFVPAGLTHTPRSDKSEVSFNPRDVESYLPYTKALRDFLAKYDDDKQLDQMKFEDCGGTPTHPLKKKKKTQKSQASLWSIRTLRSL